MFRKGLLLILLVAASGVSRAADDAAERFRLKWNTGVDYYNAGDVTNALSVLEALMKEPHRIAKKEYRARAAELVAKLRYDRAHAAEAQDPAGDLEASARAAQVALRQMPGDARANRNFSRAVDGLPALREARHANEVLARDGQQDPGALLQTATETVRRLMSEAGTYLELPAQQAVDKAAALAKDAEKASDVWISVGQLVGQSVTNEEQAATITEQMDQVRHRMQAAARQLGDMEATAYTTLSDAESDYTRFLKSVILPPAAIRADGVAQSNAWQDVEVFNNRPWQPDALDYTRAFRQKFPAWAQAYEQQAQADTNKPPFTAEAQAKVKQLSEELEKIQGECCTAPNPTLQEQALDLIRQIIELLPNDGGGGGQQQQQPRDQDQDKPQSDPNNGGAQEDPGQQQDGQDENGGQDEEPQQDESSSGEGQESADDREMKEIEASLKKAQERSDEHEEEKKARVRRALLPPNERDW